MNAPPSHRSSCVVVILLMAGPSAILVFNGYPSSSSSGERKEEDDERCTWDDEQHLTLTLVHLYALRSLSCTRTVENNSFGVVVAPFIHIYVYLAGSYTLCTRHCGPCPLSTTMRPIQTLFSAVQWWLASRVEPRRNKSTWRTKPSIDE